MDKNNTNFDNWMIFVKKKVGQADKFDRFDRFDKFDKFDKRTGG